MVGEGNKVFVIIINRFCLQTFSNSFHFPFINYGTCTKGRKQLQQTIYCRHFQILYILIRVYCKYAWVSRQAHHNSTLGPYAIFITIILSQRQLVMMTQLHFPLLPLQKCGQNKFWVLLLFSRFSKLAFIASLKLYLRCSCRIYSISKWTV